MRHKQNSNWSFLLMRGPDQSVKQFNVTKRSLIATPVALIAVVTSCVVGLQLQAASELKRIEQQQSLLQQRYDTMLSEHSSDINNKDSYINTLQTELVSLQQNQAKIDAKLIELQELEDQLQQFIQTYGEEVPISLDRSITEDEDNLQGQQQSSYQIATMAYQANAPLQEMSDYIEAMGISMQQTLRQASKVREEVDAYPNLWPTSATQITSGFGYRSDPFSGQSRFHAGIDIAGKKGDTIFSAADGEVIETGYDNQYGRYIIISHLHDLQTIYMHLETIIASEGDTVVRGEKIGLMGNTGKSTGTHLHFQIVQKNVPVSPLPFLNNQKHIKEESNV
ncbi:MAG: peptidoglycan DD-metalloendopeptidase family protein [Candidatus Pristimantibacillus lignocellulolyticus]|uniref:Peptidoglycan DD-metalloendopeptidase family protein n=1 Tax=Candidatus Pristimantibacillus lignocellulolyticus TaxID=2994561 RepID=A0A9J6ZFR1_9BACL|nr:MAG: peptidoglycan DD-metalloendopeptidase family protein [Candidatus Pristimantibacillus lignocellulolyticus]